MAVSADGTVVAVGARREDSASPGVNADQSSNTAASAGAAYVFNNTGGSWQQSAYIKPDVVNAGDLFGCRVALSGDGVRLIVGACAEASAASGVNGDVSDNSAPDAGAVYVFRFSEATGWFQNAYIKPPNAEMDQIFGDALAIDADGITLAVGAPRENGSGTGVGTTPNFSSFDAGAVYLYER